MVAQKGFGWAAGFVGTMLFATSIEAGPCEAADVLFNKPMTIVIASDTGGGYDSYGRLVARHLGDFLPGKPSITPSNMPGAGGLVATNYLYNSAPHDGTFIGIPQNSNAFDPLFGNRQTRFDAQKFNWLGSLNRVVNIIAFWHEAPVTSVDDLFKKQTILAGEVGTDGTITAQLLNQFIGTKFHLVLGYPGTSQILVALTQGEAEGTSNISWDALESTAPDMLRDKKLRLLMQVALEKSPDLPDVAMATDYLKNDGDRVVFKLILAKLEFGRPFAAPPGLPQAMVDELRDAFIKMSKDKAFLADAATQRLPIDATAGDAMQKFVADAYQTPADVVKKARDALIAAGAIGLQ
jgi:tripartite-type tricarboxylate transporter receptor subunit TctC